MMISLAFATSIFADEEQFVIDDGGDSGIYTEETEYEDNLQLLQDGYYVNEHFGKPKRTLLRSSKEDIMRERVNSAFDNLESIVQISDLNYKRTDDLATVRLVYRSCIRGNRFYVNGSYSYYTNSEDTITKIKIIYNADYCDEDGNPDNTKIKDALSKYNSRAAKAIAYADQGRDTLEKVLLAHDWIALECNYDYENYLEETVPTVSYSAYGCLVNGIAVCNGYALAYSYILDEIGCESYVASSEGMNHAWNLVNIDGNWMHVDLTWDDPVFGHDVTYYNRTNDDYFDEGFVKHTYFLKNDQEMEELEHYGWDLQNSEVEVPQSTASGLYDNAVFRNPATAAFNYCGGKWYYTINNSLCRADDLWQDNAETVATHAYYPVACRGVLYFTDLSHDILKINAETGEAAVLFSTDDTITEFGTKNGKIVYVTVKEGACSHYTYYDSSNFPEPEPVTILKCVPYEGKIKIVWEPNEEVDGYVIYSSQDSSSGYKVLKNITDAAVSTYSHKTSEATWYYKIRSYLLDDDNVKHYSSYSVPIEGVLVPSAVTGFRNVELANGKNKFTWDACADADGYVLSKSEDGGTTWKTVKNAAADTVSYKIDPCETDSQFRIRVYRNYMGKKIYGTYTDSVMCT